MTFDRFQVTEKHLLPTFNFATCRSKVFLSRNTFDMGLIPTMIKILSSHGLEGRFCKGVKWRYIQVGEKNRISEKYSVWRILMKFCNLQEKTWFKVFPPLTRAARW